MSAKLIKLPGIIDAYVHLRDPGAIQKEDFYTGTQAALAGGVVAVIDMPNNPQPRDSLGVLKKKQTLASRKAVCNFGFHFGASNNNWSVNGSAFKKLFGLKIYMDKYNWAFIGRKFKDFKEQRPN